MSIVILPSSKSNEKSRDRFEKTIIEGISVDYLSNFISEETMSSIKNEGCSTIGVWGFTPKTNRRKWDDIKTGDIVLFYSLYEFTYRANILCKEVNKELSKNLWGYDENEQTWELVLFISKITPLSNCKWNSDSIGSKEKFIQVSKVITNDDPRYSRFMEYYSSWLEEDDEPNYDNTSTDTVDTPEGAKKVYYTTKYERDVRNREKAIKIHGLKCQICGFDFKEKYGDLGAGFIEVHHIKPLYTLNQEVIIDPDKDLICVCSNCHRMIHRKKKSIITPEQLRLMIKG